MVHASSIVLLGSLITCTTIHTGLVRRVLCFAETEVRSVSHSSVAAFACLLRGGQLRAMTLTIPL